MWAHSASSWWTTSTKPPAWRGTTVTTTRWSLLLSKPAGVRVNIFTVDKAIAKMPKVEQLDEKIMMIFGNTAALLKFCQAYPKIKEINYGAVANKPGSKAFDQSVFLTPEEQADTQKLLDMGIKIYSQQTPTFKVVPIDHI